MLSGLWVDSTHRLVLIVHHLAVDGVSWRILLEDLNIAWTQQQDGRPIALPRPGTSFRQWAELLSEYTRASLSWSRRSVGKRCQPSRRCCRR